MPRLIEPDRDRQRRDDAEVALSGVAVHPAVDVRRDDERAAPVDGADRIGGGAAVGSRTTVSALCGQNYLTGSVDAELDAYLTDGILLDFAPAGADGFDPTANTGSVRAVFADGVKPAYTPLGDFDGDGKANVRDVLIALRAVIGGDAIGGNAYYGKTTIELRDVVCLLRAIAN